MKNKYLLSVIFLIISQSSYCQNENIFFESLNGLNVLTDAVKELWNSFDRFDDDINKDKVKVMTLTLEADITELVIAKTTILNKIKNQQGNDIDLRREISNLEDATNQLQKTLLKYKDLIAAIGMDAQMLSSKLRFQFTQKFNNLKALELLLPNNPDSKEIFITYLESGINILNGAKLTLRELNNKLSN